MAKVIEDTPDHQYYFTYHHTAADSITIMNPDDLDSNVLGIASLFYILADIENSIPKPKINMEKLDIILGKIQN
jgi:carboxypeptidase Q